MTRFTHLIALFVMALIGFPVWATPVFTADHETPGDSVVVFLDSLKVVEYIPNEPDELIQDRLSCLEQEIPLQYNKYVRSFVDYFTIRNRKYTRTILSREHLYFPLFEKYLKKHDLPEELKYLAVVESALNPRAISRAKAVGLWQFMPMTGNDFRLKQTAYIDERMDPEKSTEAACRFLKQLYRIFGDWEMALAAYNYGPGNVQKAIKKSGKAKPGFYDIFAYLPAETRSYVPTFSAIIYTMKYAPEHNLFADSLQFPVATDTVLINQALDLEKFALGLSMHPKELLRLNPELQKNHLPESVKNYPLRVPTEKRQVLAQNRTAIFDSSRYHLPSAPRKAPVMIAQMEPTVPVPAPPVVLEGKGKELAAHEKEKPLNQQIYTVQSGDNLNKIAREHQVTMAQLKAWNGLSRNTIQPKQKLIVYVPSGSDQLLAANTSSSDEQTQAESIAEETTVSQLVVASAEPAKSKALVAEKPVASAKKPAQKVQKIHAVQPGDTLWNISRKYEGLTVEQIRKMNRLKDDNLKPGQKLVISQS